MNCVFCKSELMKETIIIPAYKEMRYGAPPPYTIEKPTGYHICPQCVLVYKENK